MSFLPQPSMSVLIRVDTADVAVVDEIESNSGTVYETTFEAELGEELIFVKNIAAERLYEKTIDEIMASGDCYSVVVTRILDRGRGIGAKAKLQLRFDTEAGTGALAGSQVSVEWIGKTCVIKLDGPFNVDTVSKIESEVRQVWQDCSALIVSLKISGNVVGTALRILVELFKRQLKISGPRLGMAGDIARVQDAFERAEIMAPFHTGDTVQDVQKKLLPSVAVFEADPATRDLVMKEGQNCGVRVVAFPKGAHAQETVTKERPDLIMIGLVLSDVDSLDLVRKLRINQESIDIPIAILSEDQRVETVRACIEAGCTDYLLKPLTKHSFERALSNAGIHGKEPSAS